jgi:hypothetical protein
VQQKEAVLLHENVKAFHFARRKPKFTHSYLNNSHTVCEIAGYHGGNHEDCPLGRDVV